MESVAIARALDDYADLLDIQGENPFRVRSYRKAAQTLEGHHHGGIRHGGLGQCTGEAPTAGESSC